MINLTDTPEMNRLAMELVEATKATDGTLSATAEAWTLDSAEIGFEVRARSCGCHLDWTAWVNGEVYCTRLGASPADAIAYLHDLVSGCSL